MNTPNKVDNAQHSWISLATFNEPRKAAALTSALERHGMEARVHDERKLQRFWFFCKPRAGLHVEVPENSLEEAKEFLATSRLARELFEDAVHCPLCDSSRVQYPAMTRKNLLPVIAGQIAVLLRLTRHKFYCEECHHMWEKSRRSGKLPSTRMANAAAKGAV